MLKRIISFFVIVGILLTPSTNAFLFGLKSSDNTVENIINIEKTYNLYIPLVSFIYDPWGQQDVIADLKKMKEKLGDKRIYHITISPDSFSAQEVSDGKFDEQYTAFFKTIKELKLKVIFRTMHEMNGGRYPRSSNPETFKNARIHVRNLSRNLGLSKQDILFDFSVNHRDMPTIQVPSQKASLIQCTTPKIGNSEALDYSKKCFRFEDYYPGDAFVDIVGVTFYNWGKATSSRLWKTPSQILNDNNWNTVERLKKLGKPLFIDEVGTTSVRYSGSYNPETSRTVYKSTEADERKNTRLKQLSEYLTENNFLGAVYFNVDYTYGLMFPSIGETDRAIINSQLNKFYEGFRYLYSSSKLDIGNVLSLFGLASATINGKEKYVPKYTIKNINFIEPIVNNYFSGDIEAKSDFYKKLQSKLSGQKDFDEAINTLSEEYILKEKVDKEGE